MTPQIDINYRNHHRIECVCLCAQFCEVCHSSYSHSLIGIVPCSNATPRSTRTTRQTSRRSSRAVIKCCSSTTSSRPAARSPPHQLALLPLCLRLQLRRCLRHPGRRSWLSLLEKTNLYYGDQFLYWR